MSNLWSEIESQEERAKDDLDPLNPDYLWQVTSSDEIKTAIRDSHNKKHGLVYHTKATGLPSHQWYLGDRVIVYLNPSSEYHLGDPKYNDKRGLDKYILNEFGCTTNFFKGLVESGLLFVKVDKLKIRGSDDNGAPRYSNTISGQIEDLFKDYPNNVIFNKSIETSISSKLGKGDFDLFLKDQKKQVSFSGLSLLGETDSNKKHVPMTVRNVTWKDPLDKVKENYARLEILRQYFEDLNRKDDEKTVRESLDYFSARNFKDEQEVANLAYDTYLHWGTPIFYSLVSGINSVGLGTLDQTELASMQNSNKGSILFRLKTEIFGRPSKGKEKWVSRLNESLEDWGEEHSMGYYPNIGLREKKVLDLMKPYKTLNSPDFMDWVLDIVQPPILISIAAYLPAFTVPQIAAVLVGLDTAIFAYSLHRGGKQLMAREVLDPRDALIPLKAGIKEAWMNDENQFNLKNVNGFYRDVRFRVASFNYACKGSNYLSYATQPVGA